MAAREREREPEQAEKEADEDGDQYRRHGARHESGDQQDGYRYRHADRGQAGDRHHAGRPDETFLLPGAEDQPVISDWSEQERGRYRRQDEAG